MDTPAERSTRTAGPPIRPAVREAGGSRRRRPSGEPPPLPHHLQTSGIRWLVAMVVLVVLAIVVFAGGLRGIAVDVAVADAAVVGRLAGIDLPGFQGLMRGLAALSSWWVLNILSYALVLVLLVLRRFRHMIIWLVLTTLLALIGMGILGPVAQRPRPFGVEIREGWGGWAMPAMQVTFFAVGLVAILYSLVPEGRWRNTGKWVVTALVALNALGRMALGADGPTDVLVGVALGVTIPLVAFRWFTPNEVFPITYRGGSGAHLDVGGARGAAIRRGLEDQLGLVATEVKPFGLSGSAGSTPLRITVDGDPPAQLFGKLYARSHLPSDRWYKLGRELLYGRLEDEKPFNTVRRLVQQEDYALSPMQRTGGQAMEARLTAGCDVGGVAEQASAPPGVRRHQLVTRQGPVFQAVRFDVFPGGCVISRIRAVPSSQAEVMGAVPGILGYVTRDQLSQALDRRSGGRLHL
jgi:membrane-associated phospholipid phosphatase